MLDGIKLLTHQGWNKYYSCAGCNGSKREFYSHPAHPQHEVRVNRTASTFSILKEGYIVAGPTYLYNMEKHLKQQSIYDEILGNTI